MNYYTLTVGKVAQGTEYHVKCEACMKLFLERSAGAVDAFAGVRFEWVPILHQEGPRCGECGASAHALLTFTPIVFSTPCRANARPRSRKRQPNTLRRHVLDDLNILDDDARSPFVDFLRKTR